MTTLRRVMGFVASCANRVRIVHLFFAIFAALYAKKGDDAMPRTPEPYTIIKRSDSKTFQFTLNFAYGLDDRVCAEWRRRSFHDLPDDLAEFRNPKTRPDAKAAVNALIAYLRKKQEEGSAGE